ncbi:MAG: hypothetical protein JRE16_08645 [Deltaproteobacteria bacterium]|jgi:cytochrome c553|nr:hypothetical protein [Deltaproteobacteria bacterium]MBW2477861.1 hypothetical protein [Deltaproteobacteria bacterium]MBW2504621.1 hypothetical protein [Deltaproteobacteria bacterium]MBW2520233.1 hypothetical protein [Deltaproteobacteria bacterium]
MCANKKNLLLVCVVTLLLMWPALALAEASGAVHDPHQMFNNDDFQETLEARCIICHPRDRIDQAMEEGEDLDALLQRMIERGAIVNERDKSVLGTFWGSPITGDQHPGSQ